MTRAIAVIGANYGDEGKGHIVDYLASKLSGPTVVARINGGAQAGHTVITPEGTRHVFSHFGSGTLSGSQTYLAKHFVCNPLLFWGELRQLEDLNVTPEVAIDPRCFITTPYDMLINQMIENKRGDSRHGSVGVGFGETIERNNFAWSRLYYNDLTDRAAVISRLKTIRDRWIPARVGQLKLTTLPKGDPRLSDELLSKFADACISFHTRTTTAGAEYLAGKNVIFEASQGLALDMDSENFPHVTRSNTGLANIMPLVYLLSLDLHIVYVTRTYLTKHGAGPLPNESVLDPPVKDETNTDHPFQGKLRFAPLDCTNMFKRIDKDMLTHARNASWSLAVTWTDWGRIPPSLIKNTAIFSNGPRRDQTSEFAQ